MTRSQRGQNNTHVTRSLIIYLIWRYWHLKLQPFNLRINIEDLKQMFMNGPLRDSDSYETGRQFPSFLMMFYLTRFTAFHYCVFFNSVRVALWLDHISIRSCSIKSATNANEGRESSSLVPLIKFRTATNSTTLCWVLYT